MNQLPPPNNQSLGAVLCVINVTILIRASRKRVNRAAAVPLTMGNIHGGIVATSVMPIARPNFRNHDATKGAGALSQLPIILM